LGGYRSVGASAADLQGAVGPKGSGNGDQCFGPRTFGVSSSLGAEGGGPDFDADTEGAKRPRWQRGEGAVVSDSPSTLDSACEFDPQASCSMIDTVARAHAPGVAKVDGETGNFEVEKPIADGGTIPRSAVSDADVVASFAGAALGGGRRRKARANQRTRHAKPISGLLDEAVSSVQALTHARGGRPLLARGRHDHIPSWAVGTKINKIAADSYGTIYGPIMGPS
jgi:hypothetical protein